MSSIHVSKIFIQVSLLECLFKKISFICFSAIILVRVVQCFAFVDENEKSNYEQISRYKMNKHEFECINETRIRTNRSVLISKPIGMIEIIQNEVSNSFFDSQLSLNSDCK